MNAKTTRVIVLSLIAIMGVSGYTNRTTLKNFFEKNLSPQVVHAEVINARVGNLYLKFDDIEGESVDRVHRNWIDINSYSWGIVNTGKTLGTEFQFSRSPGKSSPDLFLMAANGKKIPQVTLDLVKNGDQDATLTVKLSDVVISSYSNKVENGEVVENFSLSYGRVEYTSNTNGTKKTKGWDFKKNQGITK